MCVALVGATVALLMGTALGASITGRSPSVLSDGGGVTLHIRGSGFSEDQFSYFNPLQGNQVFLVNEEEEIECRVITYLTTKDRIACASGRRSADSKAPRVYSIVVYVDGVRVPDSSHTVLYGWARSPNIETVAPRWSLPGSLLDLHGNFHTSKHYKLDYTDPVSSEAKSGSVLTKAFVGGVPCDIVDENLELYDTLTREKVTCRSKAKLVGPMNATVYVTGRGASEVMKTGMYVDSQDRLYQFHTYAGVHNVSPARGSSQGGTLVTIDGVGFDPYKEQTKVLVGGAQCAIQDITDEQIWCLTPTQGKTSAGSGERGLLVELYQGEYFESNFLEETSWAALSPSHAGYKAFVPQDAELKFPIEVTRDTVGTLKGYLHPPHDGTYSLSVQVGERMLVMLAANGDSDSKFEVMQWQEFELKKGTPAYLEIRFQTRATTDFTLAMKDSHTKFTRRSTPRAVNERQRVTLDIIQRWEVQHIEIRGTSPVTGVLYLDGMTSPVIDIADPAQVREQLLDMTEQKCHVYLSGIQTIHYRTFENKIGLPGMLGTVVGDVEPFCGRKVFRLSRNEPRIFREAASNSMINANTYRYVCFAVRGNMQGSMSVQYLVRDKEGNEEEETVLLERSFPANRWTHHCEDLVEAMVNSERSIYKTGDTLLVKSVSLPKPAGVTDDVYVDEVAFLTTPTSVTQMYPPALKQKGILIEDVAVKEVTENGYSLEFQTTNCKTGMPLLGLLQVEGLPASFDTQVTVTRSSQTATGPLAGTWDLGIQGQVVKDIPAGVDPKVLEGILESALGTDLTVQYSGSCKNYHYYIEWEEDPGRKELVEIHTDNLIFDGTLKTKIIRDSAGVLWHSPLETDFVTTHRNSPHVTVQVNGYFGACLGACAFTYDDATTPMLTGVSGTAGEGLQHTLTLSGTGFSSSTVGDYQVSVGQWSCSPTAITATQLTCTVTLWGGLHSVALSMQPAGSALLSSPIIYTVPVTVVALSITEGSTGGQYPLTVTGTGFPDSDGWEAGSAIMTLGGKKCVVISGGRTEVTCRVPAGEGTVDVVVDVGGTNGSLPSSFTYDVSLSPTIIGLSLHTLSLFGQEELAIIGTNFGTSGSVHIGSELCYTTHWSNISVSCLTPALLAGTHTLVLSADGFGAAAREVEYVLQVTSASATQGSVKGGTLVRLGGTGFGSDCSRLKVKLGQVYECEVLQCSDEALTCITRPITTNHRIVNVGTSSETVSWYPHVLEVVEGDSVTWQWSKVSENSQLQYGVCEVASPVDNCEDTDGSGFFSGTQTAAGSFTVAFPQQGIHYYAGPILPGDVVMRGQVNVVRPPHQALRMAVLLGDKEATYQVAGSQVVNMNGCDPILEMPLDGCDLPDLTTPENGYLYFHFHTCHTPVVSALASSTTHTVKGLSGLQVVGGDSLTITGSGFGDLACQIEVSVGEASCSVTSASDTSVTCDLDDLDNLRSGAYLPITVKAINRGIAVTDIAGYSSEGRVVVVPQVSSLSPLEGSLGGSTLLTISGSGLQGLVASPVVLVGGQTCVVQSVSSTTVTCLTPSSSSATVATFTLTVAGVPAKMDTLTFTYSEAFTPVVTSMAVQGEEVTLSGHNFGSDNTKVTITLVQQSVPRGCREVPQEEEKEDLMVEERKEEVVVVLKDELEDFLGVEMGDEMDRLVKTGAEDEDNVLSSKYLHGLGQKARLSLVDVLEAPQGFWGSFTGTRAATFEETVQLGAWRMAGSGPLPHILDHNPQERHPRQSHSTEDHPTSYSCTITSLTPTKVSCTAAGLSAGSYRPMVTVAGAGAVVGNEVSSTTLPVASALTPQSGSTNGGAVLVVNGSGFIPGYTMVVVGGAECPMLQESANTISCRLPPGIEGEAVVVVSVACSENVMAAKAFTYAAAVTPMLLSVTPSTDVVSSTALTLDGTGFTLSGGIPEVTVGGKRCGLVSPASPTSLQCIVPALGGGKHEVVVRDAVYGDSNNLSISLIFSLTSLTPSSGSFGGARIMLAGQGFDPDGGSLVTLCDLPCDLVSSDSTTAVTCVAPALPHSEADVTCDVVVSSLNGLSASLLGGFTYQLALTPSLTGLEPQRGSTAGGTSLTLTGTGFGLSGNEVTIGRSECKVTQEGPTSITCITEAHQGSGHFQVKVIAPGKGLAAAQNNSGIFSYIDLWSSPFTWGSEPPPSQGQLVVVTQGQTLLLDQSTPVLKMLLIQGGHVVFDVETVEELVLRAEYILIVGGGSLSIGLEDQPFPGEAVIELHGNTHSAELPLYGAKVLAVRDGTLDLHGRHVPITWTHLAHTAFLGDTNLTLSLPVTWRQGDQVVIATTENRFYMNENEVRTIASVSEDGLEVTLTEALEHTHLSVTQTLGGRTVETRAEVGLLTHNVKIRGNVATDFSVAIEGCDTAFRPDQHATQSCFNGRHGDEIGSDQFGATVILSGKFPDQDLVMGRIEYVEVTKAGQAFQLGRYPLHFHLAGDMGGSYIRGCSIHHTYNRAVTMHATNNLLVEHNVVYNNMGHAIFTEDGVEQNNVVQYNLAVYTRTSSSLLNVDVTPSSFWVVNPNNIFRHNAAAGGTHFGYWYRLDHHPLGPSTTNTYCQNNEKMGLFFNNTAHSMGRYGLWVFSNPGYHPKSDICGGRDMVAKWESFTAWHCERGAEAVSGTKLQFHNFVTLDNQQAGMEMVSVKGGFGQDDGPGIFNSLVVCHSALNSSACTSGTSGIVVPKTQIFSISNVTFVNFDEGGSAALSGCSQCRNYQGGYRAQVKGLAFENSPNKIKFQWEHETIWIDADGSLTGEPEANVVPTMGILPTDSCTQETAFSVTKNVPGSVCRGAMKFLRVAVTNPSPSSLLGKDLVVSNDFGATHIPYLMLRIGGAGWMGLVYTGATFDFNFENTNQFVNMSYKTNTKFMTRNDYYFVKHTLTQTPDRIETTKGERESLESLPDPTTNIHGDFYWDTDSKELTYMVSHSKKTTKRHGNMVFDDRVPGQSRQISFSVYKCQHKGCSAPDPRPVPTTHPDATFRWSDVETWKHVPVGTGGHPTEAEYSLPVEGDEIVIPESMWLVVDTATPKLGRVFVYGTIEFDDMMDHRFEATIIYIQGGSLVAGYSSDTPFTHSLIIRLMDPEDVDAYSMNLGWKTIGVFGYLRLHGQVWGRSWHKLGATAEVGTSHITLAEAPDASWLNKEVVVTTTAKEATESEVRRVVAINGATLTLDSALKFQHLGEIHTLSDGTSITLAGEVGLLSRNIVVEGITENSNGGRILVSTVFQNGKHYVGSAQVDGVEFRNMGQEGFTDITDPRYSIAFLGLDAIDDHSSYVKRSSFNVNYNVAVGLIKTLNVAVEENVIYHVLDSGIRDETGSNTYRWNLITTVLFLGTYEDRQETENLNWSGAFQLDNAPNTVLTGNVVAGAEQAGYKTLGEPCEDTTRWMGNEVHNAIYGVMLWKKGAMGPLTDCCRLNNFYTWRISDTGFYVQHYASSLITNVVSVDSPLGAMQIIYEPDSLSHKFHPKTANASHSLFVGVSPSHTCEYQASKSQIMKFYGDKFFGGGVGGGNTGILFASFTSGSNMAPLMTFSNAGTYPALYGSTHFEGLTFHNFRDTDCGRGTALMVNPQSEDANHPAFVKGLLFLNTPQENYMYIPRPNLSSIDPSDCVDMDCDGLKKVVVTDVDGSLLGEKDATVISQADWEWDGDPRRGIGDYRIPLPIRQNPDGSQIEAADKFPNKGIVRDASCAVVPSWQAWKCFSLRHRLMIIESMDTDTEVRRLSPIALIANPGPSGYVDLLNGPMDRGWCAGYTCQERLSTFFSVVATGMTYEMAMTSTPPQVLRLHLPHSPSSEAVVLRIFFPKPQRYDIYVDSVFVPPANLNISAAGYQLLPEDPTHPQAFLPTLDNVVGTNYFQRSAKLVHVVLRGGHVLDIKTTPVITLTSGLMVKEDEFYEQNLVLNLANLFEVSPDNIRVISVMREDSKRQQGRLEAEVASAPTTSLNGEGENGATGGEVIPYEKLVQSLEKAINRFQDGSCSNCASLLVSDPIEPPPKEAPPKATEEEGTVVIPDVEPFYKQQEKEAAEKIKESLAVTEYAEPSSILVLSGVPSSVVQYTVFEMQPSVTVLDKEGAPISDLGHKSDPWQVTASLSGGPPGAILIGTTTVPYRNSTATFTDLSISKPGEGYNLSFTITYPSYAPALTATLVETFSSTQMSAAMVLQQPSIVQAGQPIAITVQFVDEDSGLVLDGRAFKGQTFVGELLAKTAEGHFEVIQRLYVPDEAVSMLTFENVIFEASDVRQQLIAKVAVVPAGWYMESSLPRLVVYPSHLATKKYPMVRSLRTDLFRWKQLEGVKDVLEDGVLSMLLQSVDMLADGVYWGPVDVTLRNDSNKKGIAEYQITGPQEHIATALGKLCTSLSSNIAIPVVTECLDTHYNARKVYVEDQILRCSQRNVARLLNESPLLDNQKGSEVSLVSSIPKDPPTLVSPLWHHILCCSQKNVLLWNETESEDGVSDAGNSTEVSLISGVPAHLPALTSPLCTRMAKEIVLKYPEILRAGRPLSLSLKFVGADSSLLDGAVFVDQKVLIEIQGRDVSAQGEVQILKRIYLPENNLSAIPVDVVISEVSVRYQLAAKVSVVPAGWHLQFVSPDLVVYPENLEVQENSVTKNVQMNVTRWLVAAPQVNPELEDRLMQLIMGVDMSVEGVYWGPVTFAPVTSGSSKKGVASFTITGPEDSVMAALEGLCLELKAAVTIIIEQSCNKSSKYFVKKVYVEGNLLHCSQETSGTQDQLQDPQRIGRHKFSRG